MSLIAIAPVRSRKIRPREILGGPLPAPPGGIHGRTGAADVETAVRTLVIVCHRTGVCALTKGEGAAKGCAGSRSVVVHEPTSHAAVAGLAERAGEPVDEDVSVFVQASGGASARYRVRRASPRLREVKVMYGEDEWGTITGAAARAGLRPSGYVAAAALAALKELRRRRRAASPGSC